jgi:tetratricopeptide (TPR) repeat protein
MLIATITLAAAAFFTEQWPALVSRMADAAPRSDAAELRAVGNELKQADFSTLDSRQQVLVRYSIAYTNRALAFAAKTSREERLKLLEDAAEHLERAIAIDPNEAEAHALLGSVYGATIGVDQHRGAELGPKARRMLARAEQLDPHNPRVHLLLGTGAFHRPPEYGGGAEKAEVHLRKAIELFEKEPMAKPWPNWGRYEAHVYLGQTLSKLQRRDEARKQYEAALVLIPESEYVRSVLIPRLKR